MWNIIWNFIKSIVSKLSLRTWVEIIVGAILVLLLLFYIPKYFKEKKNYEIALVNNKAYQCQLEGNQKEIYQIRMDIATLKHNNDSISNKLYQAIKDLDIAEKKVQELAYLHTEIVKLDTVHLTDTIFCEPEFAFDTVIGDEWVNTKLHLEYPAEIGVGVKVKSEKVVVIHTEKEYVDPPKKFFLCRWFQKKVLVTRVTVDEKNPYIQSENNVFVKIGE